MRIVAVSKAGDDGRRHRRDRTSILKISQSDTKVNVVESGPPPPPRLGATGPSDPVRTAAGPPPMGNRPRFAGFGQFGRAGSGGTDGRTSTQLSGTDVVSGRRADELLFRAGDFRRDRRALGSISVCSVRSVDDDPPGNPERRQVPAAGGPAG